MADGRLGASSSGGGGYQTTMKAVPPGPFSEVVTVATAVVELTTVTFSKVAESASVCAVNHGTGHDSVAFSGEVKPVPLMVTWCVPLAIQV